MTWGYELGSQMIFRDTPDVGESTSHFLIVENDVKRWDEDNALHSRRGDVPSRNVPAGKQAINAPYHPPKAQNAGPAGGHYVPVGRNATHHLEAGGHAVGGIRIANTWFQ